MADGKIIQIGHSHIYSLTQSSSDSLLIIDIRTQKHITIEGHAHIERFRQWLNREFKEKSLVSKTIGKHAFSVPESL